MGWEEPGLLGSVEWVETHLDQLQKHAVAYINSDSNERGFMLPGGTQDLESLISGVARAIQDPETRMTVFERSHLYSIAKAKDAEARSEVRKRTDLEVTALGDGSDFTAFQDYAGISTLDIEFGEEDDGDSVSFDLRRFLLVHPLRRYGFRIRKSVVADRRHGDHAIGGCGAHPCGLRSAVRRH